MLHPINKPCTTHTKSARHSSNCCTKLLHFLNTPFPPRPPLRPAPTSSRVHCSRLPFLLFFLVRHSCYCKHGLFLSIIFSFVYILASTCFCLSLTSYRSFHTPLYTFGMDSKPRNVLIATPLDWIDFQHNQQFQLLFMLLHSTCNTMASNEPYFCIVTAILLYSNSRTYFAFTKNLSFGFVTYFEESSATMPAHTRHSYIQIGQNLSSGFQPKVKNSGKTKPPGKILYILILSYTYVVCCKYDVLTVKVNH